ncbi:MarR family transcriptional regulator [Bradyrhizobium sp. CSA207]|uniref:MarR family winged helix-turn-helix transcriptional regulator n=1 Tax=Bradyrhizobium sp. CSA207 TaxID=2698826 RepID=UPI0023AF4457|nr:MarR family transcriptional regulator [Bradyrhizobium sp. CSA207]MDE5444209.1 MarR family transcriptional regulator [Bradyrhizobium sp. CSA207]
MGTTTRKSSGRLDVSEALTGLQQVACTNTALRRASRRLGQLYDEALAPTGLRGTQVSLLTQIDAMTLPTNRGNAAGPTLQELASQLSLRVSGITHALTPLVRDGLVELMQDALDARVKHALLTSKGRTRLGKAIEHWAIANRHVEKIMGSAKTAKLRELADQISTERFDLSAELGIPSRKRKTKAAV